MPRITRMLLALALLGLPALPAPAHGPVAIGFGGGSGSAGGRMLPASAKGSASPIAVADLAHVFGPIINDRYDADGSNFDTLLSAPSGVSDMIRTNEAACAATECVSTISTAIISSSAHSVALPADARYLVCRDNTGFPYAPCNGNAATCVSTIAAGADGDRTVPIAFYRVATNDYVVHGITQATDAECQGTGAFDVKIVPAVPQSDYAIGDTVGPFYADTIHYSSFGSRAIADYVLASTVESTLIPRGEDAPGLAKGIGSMETDCATTGWTRTGTGTLAETVDNATTYTNWKDRGAIWGKGCSLTGTTAVGNYLQSPAWTTVAGAVYAVRFFMREGYPSNLHLLTVAITNSAAAYDFTYGANSQAGTGAAWLATPQTLLSGCQTWGNDGTWRMCIVKYRATSTSSQLRVGVTAVNQPVYLDEVYVWRADLQDSARMQPLFPPGQITATFDGDSQFAKQNLSAELGRLALGFEWAVAKRTALQWLCPVSSCARGFNGAGIGDLMKIENDDATYGRLRFVVKKPAIAVSNYIVNDLATGNTWGGTGPASPDVDEARENAIGALKTLGGYSDLALWMTPQPFGYATGASVTVCDPYECGRGSNQVVEEILHSDRVGWTPSP